MTRFYDTARWQKCRRSKLSRDPICEGCETRPGQHVDHITPVSKGGAIWKPSNWQSLCHNCHNAKTGAERAGRAWTPPKHQGVNADGSPIDPEHPWHTGNQTRKNMTIAHAPNTAAITSNKFSDLRCLIEGIPHVQRYHHAAYRASLGDRGAFDHQIGPAPHRCGPSNRS